MNKSIEVAHLKKTYGDSAEQRVTILSDVSFHVNVGEIVAVIGASGSGKSTLLHTVGGLDTFDAGEVRINGQSLAELSDGQRTRLRNESLGFVYQFHHLLPEFTALENVAMPLIIRRTPRDVALKAAEAVLTDVGLAHRLHHLPGQLSGGERQRTAIARAVVTKPACILADEPTGNLDGETAKHVFASFVKLAKQEGTAVVIVTHDPNIAAQCDRTLVLKNGAMCESAVASL